MILPSTSANADPGKFPPAFSPTIIMHYRQVLDERNVPETERCDLALDEFVTPEAYRWNVP